MSAAFELAAIAASLVAAPLLLWCVPCDPLRMLIMTLFTAFAAIAVALRWPPEISPELQAFYLRVRPPGFWRPVARSLGESPYTAAKDLARGVWATVHGSLCVFALLTLLGSLLLRAPAPSWLPHRFIWLTGLALLSAVSAFFSLRTLRSPLQEPPSAQNADSSTA